MIRNPTTRRMLALALTLLGGMALFLAPQGIWIGGLLLALGVGLEVAGALMQRRGDG